MTNKAPVASLCALLLVYTPMAAPVAATPAMLGQVMVHGQAKINGIATHSGATVFAGDQVATEPNAVAELVFNGGSKVLLPGSSAVVVNNDAAQVVVNLKDGALAMLSRSSTPAFVEATGAEIRPAANTPVVLEVAARGTSLKVLVRRGSATVETADKTLEVEEGKELDATMVPDPPQGPGESRPRPPFRSRLRRWELIAAVAGLTGLILGIIAVTRSNPAECTVISPTGRLQCP